MVRAHERQYLAHHNFGRDDPVSRAVSDIAAGHIGRYRDRAGRVAVDYVDWIRPGDSECVVADAGVRAGHAGELRERNDNGELRLKPATAATWTVSVAGTTQIDRPLPRVAPPRAFTVQFANIASQGNVLVESELANTRRELLCAEWETVNSGPPP